MIESLDFSRMNFTNPDTNKVREILSEIKLTNDFNRPVYLVGDKKGENLKTYSEEQYHNFLESGDYTEEYLDDTYSDFDNVIQWVEDTRND